MDTGIRLAPKFAIALDPAFIRATAERAGCLKMQRRTCRPLETRPSRAMQVEFSEFDAHIDLAESADDGAGEDIILALRARESAQAQEDADDDLDF